VIGDAVNLGSRLEGLSKVYGVEIVVSESARKQATEFAWQELDRVRVKGKEQAVGIFCPLGPARNLDKQTAEELRTWGAFLKAYRAQDWDQCDLHMLNLQRLGAKKYLYEMYAERVASMRLLPFDPTWDGATNFETK
jgi:adenylate cyclase